MDGSGQPVFAHPDGAHPHHPHPASTPHHQSQHDPHRHPTPQHSNQLTQQSPMDYGGQSTPAPMPPPSASQPQPPARIYSAVYSGVGVFEAMIRGIAVMRRRADSYLNATQILKVAGVEKGKRTKILEKEILPGLHEKVQGGYGKYQGTWIPFERGQELAAQFGVTHLLQPIFDYNPSSAPPPAGRTLKSPSKNKSSRGAASAYPGAVAGPSSRPTTAAQQQQHQQHQQQQAQASTALNLLNHARAQGIFVPSTESESPTPSQHLSLPPSSQPLTQSPMRSLKRGRSREESPSNAPSPAGSFSGYAPSPQNDFAPAPKRARADDGPAPPASPKPPPFVGLYPPCAASKPYQPAPGSAAERAAPRQQGILLSMFQEGADPDQPPELLTNPDPSDADFVADLVIDDLGHTALHWAASLGHLHLVSVLLQRGADVNRGNAVGETALSRAVLVPENFEHQTFPALVAQLAPAIRTLDTAGRSVLHHIALIAGVKGRSASARYYMEHVLEWIARNEQGEFRTLVDVQDVHGDTALNVAARVGNKSLVRMLLDAGANKALPNKLGLRPGDFGVEGESLNVIGADDIISTLRSAPPAPVQQSKDVIASLTRMLVELREDFEKELKTKTDALDLTQAQLRAATRELAEQRRQVTSWQTRGSELEQVRQRIRNVERALAEEDSFDWTGRTELDGSPAVRAGPAFAYRGTGSTLGPGEEEGGAGVEEADPAPPAGDGQPALVGLRRLANWTERTQRLLEERIAAIQGASADKEVKYRRVVSMCTGAPVERVEDMLDQLVLAVEVDGAQGVDIARISDFLARVVSSSAVTS